MKRLGSRTKPILITLITLGVVGATVAITAPKIEDYLQQESQKLVNQAELIESDDPRKAAVNYRLAAFLQPSNHSILVSLADMYVRLDRPADAIAVLRQLPIEEQGSNIADLQLRTGQYTEALKTINQLINTGVSEPALITKSKIMLEMDRGVEACAAAKDAVSYSISSTSAGKQLALCQLVAGDDTGFKTSIASLNDSEATRRLLAAAGYKLALARELYSQGLLRTSERTLNALDVSSTERYVLYARIYMARKELTTAKEQLVRATKLDPANIEAHQLFETVLLMQGDDAEAAEQAKQIQALQSGRL